MNLSHRMALFFLLFTMLLTASLKSSTQFPDNDQSFLSGIPILTLDGIKSIEDIQVGDLVLSANEETTQIAYRPVIDTYTNHTDELWHLHYDHDDDPETAFEEIVTTTYSYDQLGRRISRSLPGGQTETTTYNLDGTLATRTDFNGHTTSYGYEAQTSRLLTVTADPSHPSLSLLHAPASLSYTYDNAGQRLTAATLDTTGAILHQESWTYDLQGRNTSKSTPHGTLDYSYDPANNLLTVQSDNENGLMSAHSYDNLNRLSTVSDNSVVPTLIASYTYDQVGNLSTLSSGNGLTHRYSYSNLNRLEHLSIGTLSDSSNALSDFSSLTQSHTYTLNQAGHRTAVTEFRRTNSQDASRTINYTYDSLYRLTSETIGGPTIPVTGTINYTHDKVGNRLSRTTSNSLLQSHLPTQAQAYNSNDQLTTSTYDANGNTTQSPSPYNSLTYAEGSSVNDIYDFRNKLIRRNLPDGSTIDLEYNADALLIVKTTESAGQQSASTVHYLQDTNNHTGYAQIVEELSLNSTTGELAVFALNVLGHDVLHTHREDPATVWTTQHYLYDGLGSVRALSDDSGTITDTFDYDAFGTLIASTGTTPNTYLYTGERFDPDLGFYYLRARFNDTNLGRFHTLDTYEGRNGEPATLHKYLYTHGNPVNNIDPSGNITLKDLSAVARQSISLGTRVFTTYQKFVTVADTISLAISVFQIASGHSTRMVKQAVGELATAKAADNSFAQALSPQGINDAATNLSANITWVFGTILKNSTHQRVTNALKALSSPSSIFLLFMPTPNSALAPNPLTVVKTGVNFSVRGRRIPVHLYFGRDGFRGRFTGVGAASSRRNQAEIRRPHQFFRQDWHPSHKSQATNELGFRNSNQFHYHVVPPRK